MSRYVPKNNIIGLQLASSYTAGAGSFALKTGQGANFSVFPIRITAITAASYGTGSGEVAIEYTATGVSTDTLTGVAVAAGFTDQNFSVNDYIEMRMTADYITDLQTPTYVTQATEAGLVNSRKLTAGTGITLSDGGAGGNLTINATGGTVQTGAANYVGYYVTSTNVVSGQPLSSLIDAVVDNTQGDILYRNSTVWTNLTPGTAGNPLQTGGSAANPSWNASYVFGSNAPTKYPGGLIFSCGPCSAVANTSAFTSLFGSPTNTKGSLTIPANALGVNSILRWYATFTWGCTTGSPTFEFQVLLGTSNIVLGPNAGGGVGSSAVSGKAGGTLYGNYLSAVTTGASGTVGGMAYFFLYDSAYRQSTALPGASNATSTFNSTINNLFDIQFQWSAANAANTVAINSFQLFLDN